MTDRVLANLQERKAEAERRVRQYPAAVWKGEKLASNVRPCAGLVAGIAPELRKGAKRPKAGYKFLNAISGRTAELRFWIYPTHPLPLADLRGKALLAFVWLEMLLPCVTGTDGSQGMVCDFLMLPERRFFPQDHPRRWLTTVTRRPQRPYRLGGMMGTVVEPGDGGIELALHMRRKATIKGQQIVLGIEPATDPRLIRNNNQLIPSAI